jgi:uncharacterized protein involved in exopolysaccharide biosynthesis
MQNMVVVTQINPPTLPERPDRPNLMVNLALGFVASFLLAMVYIFFTKLGKI